jgi:hypothetical protein
LNLKLNNVTYERINWGTGGMDYRQRLWEPSSLEEAKNQEAKSKKTIKLNVKLDCLK